MVCQFRVLYCMYVLTTLFHLLQAIGCIRNGENMLLSNIIPGYSLAEAQDSIKEYDQFKTAMEVWHLSVCSVIKQISTL